MPDIGDPQPISAWPNQVNVPTPDGSGVSISIQIQDDGSGQSTAESRDALLQELIDYFQEWPGRREDMNVTGQRYVTHLHQVGPTNPIPLPDPPEEPPVDPLGELVPETP